MLPWFTPLHSSSSSSWIYSAPLRASASGHDVKSFTPLRSATDKQRSTGAVKKQCVALGLGLIFGATVSRRCAKRHGPLHAKPEFEEPCLRRELAGLLTVSALSAMPAIGNAEVTTDNQRLLSSRKLVEVRDPQTYPALAYSPDASAKLPLLVVLHGAGSTDLGVQELADPNGCHGGLPPSLLASGRAPAVLANNFAVVAPYAAGRSSFIREPRERLLRFVDWVCSSEGRRAGCPNVDPQRIFLFGYSDGASVGVQLACSGKFRAGVFAAVGGVGDVGEITPKLRGIPTWFFHSVDDGILPVEGTDSLVASLVKTNGPVGIRYTRYEQDQEGFTGFLKGHSVGITASKQPEIYRWLLSL